MTGVDRPGRRFATALRLLAGAALSLMVFGAPGPPEKVKKGAV